MSLKTKSISLGLMLLLGTALGAPLATAQDKIVVLDLQAAVLSTDAAQQQLQTLDQNEDYVELRSRYENLTAELEAFQEDAQKNSMTWSDEQKEEKQQQAQQLRQQYERTVQTLQGERQRVMQAVMQQMGDKTQRVVAQLIEAEEIDLVLNSQGAIHAAPDYDITEKVTELLNKAN